MAKKKLSPAERRRRKKAQEKREQERAEHRMELRLLTPEQRRRRIRNTRENDDLNRKQKRTRIGNLRETGDSFAAKKVAQWSELTPLERAKLARHLQQNEKIDEAQEAHRMRILRASGRIAPASRLDKPSRVPPLGPDEAENYENLLSGENRNAFRLIMLEFERIGLGRDLAKEVYEAVVNGVTNVEMILDIVRLSDVYKKRFPGMARRDPNLPPLSEAEYIDIEKQYRHIMEAAGLPKGFYDQPSDFANFIGNDVGPAEFQGRVQAAERVAQRVDPYQRELLRNHYGIGVGELTAYFLDGKTALPILQRHVEASGVAVYAKQAGVDQGRGLGAFGQLVDLGVTEDEARAGYGAVAEAQRNLSRFDDIYGENYSVRDAERDVFLGDSDERKRLVRKERATWSGSSRGATGTGDRSLSY